MIDDGITRRTVLRSVATAGTAAVATGTAAGKRGPTARIIGTDSPRAERAAKAQAESVKRVLDFGDIGKAVAGRFSDKAAENLSRRTDVRYVEEDGTMEALAQTLPWGIDRVDADVVHSSGETGSGADIAIIDTGIDDDHPDLQANVVSGVAFTDCKGPDCSYAWSDDHDHGTHCAGIADAVDNTEGVKGVSTEAMLHAVKVLDKRGSGYYSDIAAGIEYVADQGWDVGSMSLGGSSGSQTLRDACQHAVNNDVFLVAAAGNDGPCSDCVGYPAAYPEVMAVSSTNQNDGLSGFSSTGPEVEIAAPGSGIYSTVVGGYGTFSGTSMACPHVAGAAGQLMSNGYTNTEVRDRLTSTAEDIGLGPNESGAGLLDVEAAVGTDSGDSAPSASWANPSDGATVGGTDFQIQIDASDGEDSDGSLDVTYSVDSGDSRSTTYNTDTGYYEDSWDTTAVADGDHTLEASTTDSVDNTTSSSITVTTDNTEDTNTAPTVDSFGVSTRTSGPWFRAEADWSVADADGDLDSVTTELLDADENVIDSTSSDVSGSSVSGVHEVRTRGDGSDSVKLTVTDTAGKSASDTSPV